MNGMNLVIKTLKNIDKSSKKMLFKHFDGQTINNLRYESPILMSKLSKIKEELSEEGLNNNKDFAMN